MNSYRYPYTIGVKPFIAYKKDFKNPGQFHEQTFGQETMLITSIYPGLYINGIWVKNYTSQNKYPTYEIEMRYFTKWHVEIKISARKYHAESVELFKTAAQKFFLVNGLFLPESKAKIPAGRFSWEKVSELITTIEENPKVIPYQEIALKWKKTMSLRELKKLMLFLAIEVKFPS